MFLNNKKEIPELLVSFEKPVSLPVFDTDVSWTISFKFFQENVVIPEFIKGKLAIQQLHKEN